MRLFTALLLDERAKDVLEKASDTLKALALKGRATPRENLHVTLHFLGEIEDVEAAKAALNEIKAERFRFVVSGISSFQKPRGDIVFAAVEGSEKLHLLHSAAGRSYAAHGFALEKTPYRPHITLMRQARVDLPESPLFESFEVQAGVVYLMRSWQRDGKLVYTPIHEKKLV